MIVGDADSAGHACRGYPQLALWATVMIVGDADSGPAAPQTQSVSAVAKGARMRSFLLTFRHNPHYSAPHSKCFSSTSPPPTVPVDTALSFVSVCQHSSRVAVTDSSRANHPGSDYENDRDPERVKEKGSKICATPSGSDLCS
jgi:hypothetical protein